MCLSWNNSTRSTSVNVKLYEFNMTSIPRDTSKSSIELRTYTDGLLLDASSVEGAHSVPNIQQDTETTTATTNEEPPSSNSNSKPEGATAKNGPNANGAAKDEKIKTATVPNKAKSECTVFIESDPETNSRQRHRSEPCQFGAGANADHGESSERDGMLADAAAASSSTQPEDGKTEYVGSKQETFGGILVGFLLVTALLLATALSLSLVTT